MSDQIDDDEFTDVDDLLRWIGHARTEARALRAERDALRASADAAERDAETWRGFAIDVAREVAPVDAEDSAHQTSVDDLPALLRMVRGAGEQHVIAIARAEAAEAERDALRARALIADQWRAFALEVALQVAPLGEEQRAAQTTVRDLPAVAEALREVVAERDRADQRADRAYARKVVAENEAAALRARAEVLQVFAGSVALALTGAGAAADDLPDLLDVLGVALDDRASLRAEVEYQRARAEAAEAAVATARAEGAAAERAAVVACLHGGADAHSGFGRSVVAVALRDHVAYIEAGAHVRAVEGA
jgi:hypothetical protein